MLEFVINNFPHYIQLYAIDCNPKIFRIISKYYGRNYSLKSLRKRVFIVGLRHFMACKIKNGKYHITDPAIGKSESGSTSDSAVC